MTQSGHASFPGVAEPATAFGQFEVVAGTVYRGIHRQQAEPQSVRELPRRSKGQLSDAVPC